MHAFLLPLVIAWSYVRRQRARRDSEAITASMAERPSSSCGICGR